MENAAFVQGGQLLPIDGRLMCEILYIGILYMRTGLHIY
jgi:hypothetical protein